MSNQAQNSNDKKYDLEERTGLFGEAIIDFGRSLKSDAINRSLIDQVVRSGTSIGANYVEADGAESKRIFDIRLLFARKRQRKQSIGCG